MRISGFSTFLLATSLLAGSALAAPEGAAKDASTQSAESTPKATSSAPDTRLILSHLSIIRYNPLGLETQNRLMYQSKLMDSDSVLFSNTYAAGGLSFKLNPAFYKIGPLIEVQPIALFNLRLGYEYMQFFGTFDYVQSYPDPSYSYDDDFRSDVNAANAYTTAGHHIFIEPTLQAKAGRIAIRSKWAIEYWNMGLKDAAVGTEDTEGYEAADGVTDTVFYDATLDTNVPANGWVVATDTDLLYVSGGKLTAGLRYSAVFPQYSDAQWPGGTPADYEAASHHRLGPLLAWTFNPRDYSGFNKPTLLLVGGYYLSHRYRAQPQAPYILVGFAFNSDFLRAR